MDEPILNRVQASGILQIELTQWLSPPPASVVDLAGWLDGGLVLRERAFRASVEAMDVEPHRGHVVALSCSTNAILPDWAWLLVALRLKDVAVTSVAGSLRDAEREAWLWSIQDMDLQPFHDARVIVKGCATPGNDGVSILAAFVQRIQPHVKSLMFGEACSSVPLFKRPSKP